MGEMGLLSLALHIRIKKKATRGWVAFNPFWLWSYLCFSLLLTETVPTVDWRFS